MNWLETILKTNVINFIIFASIFVAIYKKFQFNKTIQKLADDVKEKIETSINNAKKALDEYKETKRAQKNIPILEREILDNAQNNAQNIKAKIEADTHLQQMEIENNKLKALEQQEQKIKFMTANELFNVCVDIAQDELISKLDKEAHQRILNSSIDELEKIEGNLIG